MGNHLVKEALLLTPDWHFFLNLVVQSYCLSLPYTHTVPQSAENPAILFREQKPFMPHLKSIEHMLIILQGGKKKLFMLYALDRVCPPWRQACGYRSCGMEGF